MQLNKMYWIFHDKKIWNDDISKKVLNILCKMDFDLLE